MEERLTSLAHGGGCGCKIAPNKLQEILGEARSRAGFPNLLVGTETSDDAAVWRLTDELAIVATTDFFTPIVDDPFDFGRIAATNAISDVYAMGGTPIFALAILGMPIGKLDSATIQRIVQGGEKVCADAGIPVAGGHSIDSAEPIYGLAVLGLVNPGRILRNSTGRAGDRLILAKPLGVGVFSAALKKGALNAAGYAELLELTTRLNRVGAELGGIEGVHAVTDVTGFGLLGHLLEMCRGAGLSATVDAARVPILPRARALCAEGFSTGASTRNWASYGHEVDGLPDGDLRKLLTDPQTAGPLLVACAPAAASTVLELLRGSGFSDAADLGALGDGPPRVFVR